MRSEKARKLIETMEVDYNARNKMINSTVAHQAVQLAEEELKHKAIDAFRLFVKQYFAESGRKDISEDSEQYVKVFKELINS